MKFPVFHRFALATSESMPYQLHYETPGAPVFVHKQLARQHNDTCMLMRMLMLPMYLTEQIHMRVWTLPEAIFSNRMLHRTLKS